MDDDVQKALEAACNAMIAATLAHEPPKQRVADAIAAFLRALPDYYGGDTLNLADAVEAAGATP